jgi:hypothetical protein
MRCERQCAGSEQRANHRKPARHEPGGGTTSQSA